MKIRLLFFVLLPFVFSSVTAQTRRYVKTDGSGDGSSWIAASADIQQMMDEVSAEGGGEVWVAQGKYIPQHMAGNGNVPEHRAFVLKPNVKLYGGFYGVETNLDQRIVVQRTELTGLDETKSPRVRSVHVVIAAGELGDALIDGFVISKGGSSKEVRDLFVNSKTIKSLQGTGLYNHSSTLKVSNMVMENLGDSYVPSSAVYNESGTLTMENVSLNGSFTRTNIINDNATFTAKDCEFKYCNENNLSSTASVVNLDNVELLGGIANVNCTVTIKGSRINTEHSRAYCAESTLRMENSTLTGYNGLTVSYSGVSKPVGDLENPVAVIDGLTSNSPVVFMGCAAIITNSKITDSKKQAFIVNNATVKISGLEISRGAAGGATIGFSTCEMDNVLFLANSSTVAYGGGGALMANQSDIKMTGVVFESNSTSKDGGAFYNSQSTVEMNGVTFRNNSAGENAGAILNRENSVLTMNDVEIDNNRAGMTGGGIYNIKSTLNVQDSKICENRAVDSGGGIYNENGALNIKGSIVSFNLATGNGGGILNTSLARTGQSGLLNTLIAGNMTEKGMGGGIYNGLTQLPLVNVTIADNAASSSGAGIYTEDANMYVVNSIIWNNNLTNPPLGTRIHDIGGKNPQFEYCLVRELTGVKGVIMDEDPRFIGDDEYNLTEASSAINMGNNECYDKYSKLADDTDAARNIRFCGSSVDLGAYEFQDGVGIHGEQSADNNVWYKNGILYIDTNQPAHVQIYTLSGVLVMQRTQVEGEIPFGADKGVYVVKVNNKPYKVLVND